MSTYRKDSEITRFNTLDLGKRMAVSDDFIRVMKAAKYVYQITGGAWDGTIYPLVNLWGFGKDGKKSILPEPEEVRDGLRKVGFDAIEIIEDRYLIKKEKLVTLDLASIAKGYAVDQISEAIQSRGITNFLVEVGGEIYASGHKKDGGAWGIGINTPKAEASMDTVYKVVPLNDKAMATSGDYRHFFIKEGKNILTSLIHEPDVRCPTGWSASQLLPIVVCLQMDWQQPSWFWDIKKGWSWWRDSKMSRGSWWLKPKTEL
jgi:thiamine biosynthesis lipoprotein